MAINTLDDYLSLITSLYRDQPNFVAFCTSVVQPIADAQTTMGEVRDAFDLDTAIGSQLDKIGEWVGRSRFLETPLVDVYFSWNTDNLGWEQGSWLGLFDPVTGLVSLPDESYRTLLRAKIAANAWDGTIPGAYEVWETAFAGTGSIIIIQDNQDMSMVVGIAGVYPDAITKALLTGGYIPLKPSGVRINYYAVAPVGGPLFGWNIETDAINGWGIGSWPEIITP